MELIEARSIFTAATGFIRRGGFAWTCNPYLGCSFGCRYCYAMALPQNRRPRSEWGRWFAAKQNAVALAERQAPKLAGQAIYLSSVTDPYLPVERSLKLTRGILESILPYQPKLVVQTRGPLVTRDRDLFVRFDAIRVNISIPTDNEAIRQRFEAKAPPLERRWTALKLLREAGIPVGICVTPMLPLASPATFIDRLLAAEADVLVIQDFHAAEGCFGADTAAEVFRLAEAMGWTSEQYLAVKEALQRRAKIHEGEAGFFPPVSGNTS